MHIPKGRRHWDNKETLLCLFLFMFALWCFELYLVSMLCSSLCIVFVYSTCIHPYAIMLQECMFGWSFDLLCDHCSHFYMIVLVYDQVAYMFHIMFTWSQFTCYIIFVLLLFALPWGSTVFCASVSGHMYLCSKFNLAPMTRNRGSDMIREVFIFVLWVLYLCLYPCYFCKLLGFVFIDL